MRAKFINENNEGSLHPSMPSLIELKDIFADEVNSVVDLIINDNGSIEYDTYPGSSLKSEIKELFKSRGWDKFYNIKKIEFEGGNYHEYIINPYKSDSERIIPSFDPTANLPKEEAEEASDAQEFIENFINEAVWESDRWLRMEPEEWEEMGDDERIAFMYESIDDFFEYYSGEFLENVFSENRDHIISAIVSRLG